jgi:hypothetical protein
MASQRGGKKPYFDPSLAICDGSQSSLILVKPNAIHGMDLRIAFSWGHYSGENLA